MTMAGENPIELIPDFIEQMAEETDLVSFETMVSSVDQYEHQLTKEVDILQYILDQSTAEQEKIEAEVDRLSSPSLYEEHEHQLSGFQTAKREALQRLQELTSEIEALDKLNKKQRAMQAELEKEVKTEKPNEIGLRLAMYDQLGFEAVTDDADKIPKIRIRGKNDVHTLKIEKDTAPPTVANEIWQLIAS